MALTLSSRDVSRLAKIQQRLLSPLEHKDIESWSLSVLRHAEPLFHADRSALLFPVGEELYHVSETIEPKYLKAFSKHIDEVDEGALRYSDQLLERAFTRRRESAMEVWSMETMARLIGRRPEEVPIYHEAIGPAGIAHSRVMTTTLPVGEATLGLAQSNPSDDPFDEENGLKLMRLLLPAFKAGLHTLARLDRARKRLVRAVDELGERMAVFSLSGRELHRSAQLKKLLAGEPERESLESELKSLALVLGQAKTAPRQTPSDVVEMQTRVEREFVTDTAGYALRASYVGRGVFGLEDAIAVTVERLTPKLPTVEKLTERYGLTPRQAEVALLMAQGLPDRAIAERLGISWHTVRRHAEWVLLKTHVETRAALGIEFLKL